jgi:hypothetical protein
MAWVFGEPVAVPLGVEEGEGEEGELVLIGIGGG